VLVRLAVAQAQALVVLDPVGGLLGLPAGTAQKVRAAALAVLRAADDGVAALCEGFQLARNDLARRQEAERREVFEALLAGGLAAAAVLGRAADLGLDLTSPHALLVAAHPTGRRLSPVLSVCSCRRAPVAAVGSAGGVLLATALEVTGLSVALRGASSRWRKPTAVHHPGNVVADLAVGPALGGDCLADAAVLRSEPGIYGRVASEATVSRTVSVLAGDADRVLAAVAAARRAARARAWELAGEHAPNHAVTADDPLVVDLDATLVTLHSDKEQAAPNFKRGYRFHPVCAFVDHGGGHRGSSRSGSGRGTPARTPRPITSPSPRRR